MRKPKEKESPKKLDIKCIEFQRGFCSWKERCKYQHPEKVCQEYSSVGSCSRVRCRDLHRGEEGDCIHWMRGDCSRQSSPGGKCSRGNHNQAKFNIRPKSMSQEEKIADALLKKMQFTSHPAGSYLSGHQPSSGQINRQPASGQHMQQQTGQPSTGPIIQQPSYGQQQIQPQPANGQEGRLVGVLQQMQEQMNRTEELLKQQQFTSHPAGSNVHVNQPSSQQQSHQQMIHNPAFRQQVQQNTPGFQGNQLQQPAVGQQVFQQQQVIQENPTIGQQVRQQEPANGLQGVRPLPANGQPGFQAAGFGGQQSQYDYSQQGWAGLGQIEQMEMGGQGGPPAPFHH